MRDNKTKKFVISWTRYRNGRSTDSSRTYYLSHENDAKDMVQAYYLDPEIVAASYREVK